jgi:hypothetical protein
LIPHSFRIKLDFNNPFGQEENSERKDLNKKDNKNDDEGGSIHKYKYSKNYTLTIPFESVKKMEVKKGAMASKMITMYLHLRYPPEVRRKMNGG